jgi:hypothetical protein
MVAVSTSVAIETAGTVTGAPGDDVNVHPETGVLRLEGDAPTVRIEQFEDAGFRLSWHRLRPGGAVMVQVFDAGGDFIDGSIQDDPEDALLAVAERLLPPPE